MKKFTLPFICLSASILIIASCTKSINDNSDNAVAAGNYPSVANVSSAGSHFGVLTNAAYSKGRPSANDTLTSLNFESKLRLASYFQVKYLRMAITHDRWNNTNATKTFVDNFEAAYNAGFSILLNVNYNSPGWRGASEFPSAAAYGEFLQTVLNTLSARNPALKPELVVVENEETNSNYFKISGTADADKYVNLLKTAIAICAPRNIKVTNGGITSYILTTLTWDWLKTQYGVDAANNWAANVMAPNLYHTLNSSEVLNYIRLGKYMINKYSTLPLSYINIHWYEPLKASQYAVNHLGDPFLAGIDSTKITASAIDSCVSFLNATFKNVSVITNETGQVSKSNRLTASLLNKYFHYQTSGTNFPIVVWYDGDGDDDKSNRAKALHNAISSDSFTVRAPGITFHNHLQR